MLGQYHVDVAEVVEHLAVELLRHALIETAVTRFHMENRNLPTLGGDYRQASIGIAVKQQRIGLFQLEDFIRLGNHFGDRTGRRRTHGAQEVVRLANAQVVEEHLVELVVVVLPGVHQDVVSLLIEFSDDAAHLDQFGPSTDQGHDLKH